MKAITRKKIKKIFFLLIAVYVLAGILLYFFQDLLLFHPLPRENNYQYNFKEPFEEVNIKIKDRNVNLVKFKPSGKVKGLVLFFHGNMKNVEHYKKYPSFFLVNNYEIWMHDYPGFGKTTGKRAEDIMYQDALMIYEHAVKQTPDSSILIYGKSMGTGVASYLASIRPCKQLILETPYYSIEALANAYLPMYPVNPMSRYKFPVNSYLRKIKVPVTIFHGTDDGVIPYKQAALLKKENESAELVSIENGEHNNLSSFPLFKTRLDSLLR